MSFVFIPLGAAGAAEILPWDSVSGQLTRKIGIRDALRAVPQPPKQPADRRHPVPVHQRMESTPGNLDHLPNGCGQKSGALCYDYRSGQTLFKPMRKFLPSIPGMVPHNLSIHRAKILAQYTFK